MANITITTREGYSDCECCGSYDWEEISVKKDGTEILEHYGDGHLGGGVWHDWDQALLAVLEAMGHTVTIDRNHCGSKF